MIVRHVPKGTEGEFAGANYDVKGTLPAILTKRAINRGIETLAISPDERFLYFVMQNPLANPDVADLPEGQELAAVQARARDHAGRRRVRLHARRSQDVPPRSVREAERSAHQRDDGDRARPADRARAHRADHQAARDRPRGRDQYRRHASGTMLATRPTLEQTDVAAAGIKPVSKALRFDSADFPEMVGKTEGMALLGDGSLAAHQRRRFRDHRRHARRSWWCAAPASLAVNHALKCPSRQQRDQAPTSRRSCVRDRRNRSASFWLRHASACDTHCMASLPCSAGTVIRVALQRRMACVTSPLEWSHAIFRDCERTMPLVYQWSC